MKEATVTLRSKRPDFFNTARKHTFEFLPLGKYKGQATELEDGWFYCDVPTKIEYTTDFGEVKTLFENYAQVLVDSYPHLEVVEVKEKETMEAPIIRPKKKGQKKDEVPK